ncbi:bifunctional (p)ppGpp synthetase/guanosine-3',5'-bis(diphosphate) 3'-pyrophosphohydrolase [Azovibrio restrictus]|uniref:RelA/SpoT family protein n=1 Tax=Azovibrio restrictus TaxID=146938 RepID=UPI0026F2D4F9|nr:bifunctional (p)ppGpp synthetase/guanosine-3',5'-bis(diphosphate) 3'-pyrophosphohydrolase [Azovibrio restrictus]MDD3482479.1 bifunctional (p)ppGpp synthetase/guanosine-3',5'-bis(diphosphate) 3'-pyrophosphohydrolase [Azovibrio restrictus]
MASSSVQPSPPSSTASPAAALRYEYPEGDFCALRPDDPAYRVFIDSLDYLSPEEIIRVKDAVCFSDKAHEHQVRLSGEPYITHPLSVAGAVVEWRMDADAVCAALLHDVLEDTGVSKTELAQRFGTGVADLVDGLSKLDKIEFASHQEAQAENFRKMLLAMARDLRVVLIKLADRHHNLQTMSAVRPDKRRRIARETLEIYAPIANRLGLNKMFRDLQDTSFKLIHPMRARVLGKAVQAARGHRKELLQRILDSIRAKMNEVGILAQVFGREKSLFSIYTKMEEKHLSFSQVLDIYGFRVVVKDIPTCYLALGALHALFKPVPGKFKDYIAIPKANGYQSLHTTLIGPFGTPVEVQIRTEEMHHVAQEGVASHWLYKDAEHSGADLQIRTHKWLQSLLEMQSGDSSEFFENVKIDLFPDEVYVFTPKGRIMALPQGATPVDMAYAIHTDVGNCCIAARINHELVPLRTELKNGDVVEIVTAAHANPNPAWLSYVKTGRARSKIRHFLRTVHNEESAALGERLLNQELKTLGVEPPEIPSAAWERLVKASGNRSIKEVFTDIGLGKRLAAVAARRLLLAEDAIPISAAPDTLVIRGTEGIAIQLAKCCQPIPGDPIIGSIKKGQGLVVHTHDCPVIRKSRSHEPHKWIDVEWEPSPGSLFEVRIDVEVKNARGVLAQVASAIADSGSNIENVSMEGDPEKLFTRLHFSIQVGGRVHLAHVMRNLRTIPNVVRISRQRSEVET